MAPATTPSLVSSLGLATLCLFAATSSPAAADSLEDALAKQDNLTTFRAIVEEHPEIYSALPSSGVTIIVPNDGAFVKGEGWDTDEDSIPAWLLYGILDSEVELGPLSPGDTFTATTLLNDTRYANLTGAGQTVLVTMQPGEEVVLTSGVGTRVTVVESDVPFDGGLVHVVESLTVTPRRLEPSIRDSYTDLTAFLGALYKAGLVDEFAETPDATVLAPHNSAFQRLAGFLENMDDEDLRRVLRYHLVTGEGVLRAADLEDASELGTALSDGGGGGNGSGVGNTNSSNSSNNGTSVYITRYVNDIFANTARIIQTDLLVANGMVHVIDSLLNVDEADARPDVSESVQDPVFTFSASDGAATATGADVTVPFSGELPCTEGCASGTGGSPAATSDGGGGGGGGGTPDADESENWAVRGPSEARCTGVAMGVVVGVLGMEVWGGI